MRVFFRASVILMSDDECMEREMDGTYHCGHCTERDIPSAVDAVRQLEFSKPCNPMVCYDCKTEVPMMIRFGGKSWLGWTLKREILFTCPACRSEMGYYI